MSDPGRTEPLQSRGTARPADDLTVDHGGATPAGGAGSGTSTGAATGPRADVDRDARSGSGSGSSSGPIEAVKDPDNRAKLALATAALTLLNLLLLVVILTNVLGDDYEQVTVDGQPCVVQLSAGESVLYCQR